MQCITHVLSIINHELYDLQGLLEEHGDEKAPFSVVVIWVDTCLARPSVTLHGLAATAAARIVLLAVTDSGRQTWHSVMPLEPLVTTIHVIHESGFKQSFLAAGEMSSVC